MLIKAALGETIVKPHLAEHRSGGAAQIMDPALIEREKVLFE
ncbi:hypothetical protein PCO85_01140 [Prodigiosinella aquatilis]|nr:hypothetical protein [Prodigiosinella sp. LS101]WJV54128.1 hypothetical protein PCO85_01140 [Prodigiosinella sp. LS101]WJV58491.1 hypothetical protein PCO84_01145 [Pectobacteriaceae bacterium C111]